jgi:AGCS family alanine or glycine:cation symporter
LPGIGGTVVAISSLLFGYSSLIANPYYGEISFAYLFGTRIRLPFRWIYCGMILLGAVLKVEVAWSIGDVLNGMMALTNSIGLFGLGGAAVAVVHNYMGRLNRRPDERSGF